MISFALVQEKLARPSVNLHGVFFVIVQLRSGRRRVARGTRLHDDYRSRRSHRCASVGSRDIYGRLTLRRRESSEFWF